jgi:hypothetical protein
VVSFGVNGRELSNGFNTLTAIPIPEEGVAYKIISLHAPVLGSDYAPTGTYLNEPIAQIELMLRPSGIQK